MPSNRFMKTGAKIGPPVNISIMVGAKNRINKAIPMEKMLPTRYPKINETKLLSATLPFKIRSISLANFFVLPNNQILEFFA